MSHSDFQLKTVPEVQFTFPNVFRNQNSEAVSSGHLNNSPSESKMSLKRKKKAWLQGRKGSVHCRKVSSLHRQPKPTLCSCGKLLLTSYQLTINNKQRKTKRKLYVRACVFTFSVFGALVILNACCTQYCDETASEFYFRKTCGKVKSDLSRTDFSRNRDMFFGAPCI